MFNPLPLQRRTCAGGEEFAEHPSQPEAPEYPDAAEEVLQPPLPSGVPPRPRHAAVPGDH